MSGESVRAARDRHLAANGFGIAGYRSHRFPVRVGPLTLVFSNPGLLPWHDLHHVATGYGTDLVGEAEISVFELRGGGVSALVFLLCVSSILIVLPLAPARMLRAWREARAVRTLYHRRHRYAAVIGLPLAELRRRLGIPVDGFRG